MFGFILIAALTLVFFAIAAIAKLARDLPNPEQFEGRSVNQSTKIYDRTGAILLYEIHGEENRTVIPFEQIPDYAKRAAIAIEDQKFYEHEALDWRATIRAIIVNIWQGRISQGGSTITQQLVKNAFLTPERTFTRKVKEMILARWIEQKYSKDEILNLYLNQISYGANAYGLEAASQTYFGKPAKDLKLEEAATLAALPKAPSYYSPWGPRASELEARKNYILEQMLKLGFIDEEEKSRAQGNKLKFASPSLGSIKAPHFVMMVRDYLNNRYGEEAVEREGLKVITTLDYRLQEIAERVVKSGAARNSELYNGRNASLVAQDPKTGQLLALVGSKYYFGDSEPEGCVPGACQFEGNFNVASQGLRQPGSSFKPFAYAAAFRLGYPAETMLFDLPTEFSTYGNICPLTNINFEKDNDLCFHPENFDHKFRGPVSLRGALAQSINVPSVKVLYLVGIPEAVKTASAFGITTLTDPSRYGLSLVLGGGEVKLIDMVSAYSVFSQEGVKHRQSFILEIKDANGNILEKYLDNAEAVADPEYIRLINDILSDSEARSPLFQNSLNLTTFPDRDAALKTGTTNDYRDAWAMGYTPSLTVGVWAGNNNNKPMQKQAGSILAAVPIWHAFLEEALSYYPQETFTRPEPSIREKPMLNGQYSAGNEAHTILYYVNKNDPLGPIPQNPESDSQFFNWEIPVREWIKNNLRQADLSGAKI
ncbi:transglycosylase domain-containing protein [Candidatus Wolfebacteria bacterium]|nr:transglycosylase domain-containing protein [Candidatus Wolfebacteria bacterium]